MGLWKDIKNEWTWDNIVRSWPDFVAVFIAGFIASQFYDNSLLAFIIAWFIAFNVSRFIITSITTLIKRQ